MARFLSLTFRGKTTLAKLNAKWVRLLSGSRVPMDVLFSSNPEDARSNRPTKEISGRSSWANPAGFQEIAVASSARPMKAPPIPKARAPCPVRSILGGV